MAAPSDDQQAMRDEAIKTTIKRVLGMSVPKYIAIVYDRSQKAAQIMFNQPEKRQPKDEELLDGLAERCEDEDQLANHFISHILGSDPTVLNNIQTTIDSRFLNLEATNTVKSLSRPMISNVPEIRQVEMINDKYFYTAVDMQNQWLEAKMKQEELKGKATVHIPYTLDEIKNAFLVVIDMCLLIIDLKAGDDSAPAREALARAYALLSAAAIQMGRYDIVEEHIAQWRDRLELHTDPQVPLRVRNLLLQKELWLSKRKGEYAIGLEIAQNQWKACMEGDRTPRWTDLEPLACAGLELAALQLKAAKGDEEQNARDQASAWLSRFNQAPDRAEELGEYLQTDPELEAIRDNKQQPSFRETWSQLMKKFGMLLIVFIGLTAMGLLVQTLPAQPDFDQPAAVVSLEQPAPALDLIDAPDTNEVAGANPGKIIMDLIGQLLEWFA